MADQGDKPGLRTRKKELKSAEASLRDLRGRRASAARDRLIKAQEKLVGGAKTRLERIQRVLRGESALPESTGKKSSAQQSMRDRIAAERELGLKRGGN